MDDFLISLNFALLYRSSLSVSSLKPPRIVFLYISSSISRSFICPPLPTHHLPTYTLLCVCVCLYPTIKILIIADIIDWLTGLWLIDNHNLTTTQPHRVSCKGAGYFIGLRGAREWHYETATSRSLPRQLGQSQVSPLIVCPKELLLLLLS